MMCSFLQGTGGIILIIVRATHEYTSGWGDDDVGDRDFLYDSFY